MSNAVSCERLTIDRISNEGCINILSAFLKYLSIDYKQAYMAYCNEPGNNDRREHYKDLRDFITSDYFCQLTNLIGEDVADTLERYAYDI